MEDMVEIMEEKVAGQDTQVTDTLILVEDI
jgi:hypothetical protein